MKQITKELIEEHFGEQKRVKRRWWGSWFVELESGASVTISRKGVDFGKYRELKNRTEIDEELFQQEVWSGIDLAADIFGGLGLYGDSKPEDRATILDYATAREIDTGDHGLLYRHFGPEATAKLTWGGLTINVPNRGYVKVQGGAIEKVCGDLLRPALAMGHEIGPEGAIVRGKADLLVMATHEARALGIPVITESDLSLFMTITSNLSVWICMALGLWWLNGWQGLLAGLVGGYLLFGAAVCSFQKQIKNMARRKGLEIVGFDTPPPVRKASIDEAKKKGML